MGDDVTDSDDKISGIEKINTLWKQYNNLINTKPNSYAVNEEVPFINYVISDNIFNQNVPKNILITSDTILNIILPNNETIEFLITPNDFLDNNNYLNIHLLDILFDNCDNILPGSKCNFENLGYNYLEYYYKKECYPTIYATKNQLYTWFIPEPSNGNITNSNTKNLLKNTIAFLYDPYYNTYKYRLYYKSSGNFIPIFFASYPEFAYLDNKSGFLYFYGGSRTNNTVTLEKIRSQNDSNAGPSPPYLSYIRYNGNTGFDNVEMSGNIKINGTLDLSNNYTYNDLSDASYNVLNLKQLNEWYYSTKDPNGNGDGIPIDESYVLEASLNDWCFDLSVLNVDICYNLNVNGKTNLQQLTATDVSFSNLDVSNLLQLRNDLSFTDISGKTDACYNVLNLKQLNEWYSTKDLSYVLEASLNDYSFDLSVLNVDISGDISINGTINNVFIKGWKDIINVSPNYCITSDNFNGYIDGYIQNCIFIGENSFSNKQGNIKNNIIIGNYDTHHINNFHGIDNISVGNQSLSNNQGGSYNTAFGYNSLESNTTGNNNIGIGYTSLQNNTTGSYNINIGNNSNCVDSNNTIVIGYGSNLSNNPDLSNQIVIGTNLTGKGPNTVSIGNIDTCNNYFNGTLNLNNDLSFTDISGTPDACYNVLNLKQLNEWYSTKDPNGSYVLEASLNDYYFDLKVLDVDVTGDISINGTINNVHINSNGENNIYIGFDSGNTNGQLTNYNNEIIIGASMAGNGSDTVTIGNSNISSYYFNSNSSSTLYCGNITCSSITGNLNGEATGLAQGARLGDKHNVNLSNQGGGWRWWRIDSYASWTNMDDFDIRLYFKYGPKNINDPNMAAAPYIDVGYPNRYKIFERINFTGQHRCIINLFINNNHIGLIVSTIGKYLNFDNNIKPTINDSLPICILSNVENDKKVFGVISNKEDKERKDRSGSFVTPVDKENINENRFHINSLGEGSIWVCNKNGNLENGDYISSSNIIGYGQKQLLHEDFLTKFTVAKITCDCNFSLNKQVKQKVKIIFDSENQKNLEYDENGGVIFEDDLDASGNPIYEYTYDTRFLDLSANILSGEEEYLTRLNNNENVYIACFVGCTYHCG